MSKEVLDIKTVYSLAREYFPTGHLQVEIWDIGLKFVWDSQDKSGSAVLQKELSIITESTIRGFLDAETRD